jgi:HAD superfamily hydrolase (TIGR01509 family)
MTAQPFAKPDVAYFNRVLELLDLPSQCVLFIDGRAENVDAAKRAGLLAEHGVSATAGQSVDGITWT